MIIETPGGGVGSWWRTRKSRSGVATLLLKLPAVPRERLIASYYRCIALREFLDARGQSAIEFGDCLPSLDDFLHVHGMFG